MGNDIVRKRVEHGVVWVTVRVHGYLYDVAAPASDEWTLHMPGGIQHGLDPLLDEHRAAKAKELVTKWAHDNIAELDFLFRKAKEQRADALEHGRRRPKPDSEEGEDHAGEQKLAPERDSGVRYKVTGGMSMQPAKGSPRRVLLVDDEVLLHRAVARAASAVGIEILHAMDGATGVRMAAEENPGLILLDMNLPDTDGTRVLRCLKETPQTNSIPVLIFSARTDHDGRIATFQLGADDYLEKPFQMDMLVRRIEHHLFKASEVPLKSGVMGVAPPVQETPLRRPTGRSSR
jgi:CheY-like chemotaxis protein